MSSNFKKEVRFRRLVHVKEASVVDRGSGR